MSPLETSPRATALLIAGLVSAGTSRTCAQDLPSSRLPIIEIDLAHERIPDEPKAVARMRIVYNGPDVENRPGGPTGEYVGAVGVERRGSTSQFLFPKTGYGLELRTADDRDTSAALLGMPREEDWVLHGPYSDKSLIRNAFAYSLGARLMDYAPRVRFVELVLGGDYRGVYVLTERVKRDRNRVDVARLGTEDISGEALTGGYILKVDKSTGEGSAPGRIRGFELPRVRRPRARPTRVLHHYPRPRDITPAQSSYIEEYLRDFEARLASDDFDDPVLGYAPVADVETFVNYLIVNEVTRNVDAYRISTFLHKDRDGGLGGGRLRMGPVWDYNLALANADYCSGSAVRGWAFNFSSVCPEDGFYVPFWYPRLFQSAVFREALHTRYTGLRTDGPLSDRALFGLFDSLAAALPPPAVERNFARWPGLGTYTWPNSFVPDSHAEAVAHARDFLARRLGWLDEQVAELAEARSPGGADTGIRFGPNPGHADARLFGLAPADYPVHVRWFDEVGREVGEQVVTSEGAARPPDISGLYTYRITRANGEREVGRFLSLGLAD